MKKKIWKRGLALLLICIFLFSDVAQTVYAASINEENSIITGTCGDDLTWVLEDGILTIEGTGTMKTYL